MNFLEERIVKDGVVKEGNIIEQGNHNELMKQNGFYADLYNSQFQLV